MLKERPVTAGLRRVWRKLGPSGWVRIVGTQLKTDPWYDGGMEGVSVQFSDWGKGGFYWKKQTRFIVCLSVRGLEKKMREMSLFLPQETRKQSGAWCPKWPKGGE